MQQRHMRLDHVDRCTGTTGVLNGQRVKPVGARSAKMWLHPRDLHDFITQTDRHGRAHIRMDRMPPQHMVKNIKSPAAVGHAAAGSVGQSDDTVNAGVVFQ